MRRGGLLFSAGLLLCAMGFAQVRNPLQYVDPFIGTTKSKVLTNWGSEGGTYPGAAAPSGYIQLTPETRLMPTRGYDYSDSSIYFFSCLNHFSGFPNGSSGQLYVMPVDAPEHFQLHQYKRRFSHQYEKAGPGYYQVLFEDNHTLAEATASIHTGMFRFTFPSGVIPHIFIEDAGTITASSKKVLHTSRHNAVIHFSEAYTRSQEVTGGSIFTFAASDAGTTVITLQLSASTVGFESAQKNIDTELHAMGFDSLRERTRKEWMKELSVVDIDDNNAKGKTVFYTALYHSLLVPWIISDVDGNYRGPDGLVHTTRGKHTYGAFSPWDTFRTLHPLLCLLYPIKQRDMVLSMLDIYQQSGYLPVESMTGNHAIPIIVDSYLKGITANIDSSLAYAAMQKSIVTGPFIQGDMSIYQKQGYIPLTYPESVTRTVEYAYDDWALAVFAKQVMNDNDRYSQLLERSFHYRKLFNAGELLLLPRNEAGFKLHPGTFGYKEGDPWTYSYFVPHNARDLVNLMGGNASFASRLDDALHHNRIVFDNETVFHVPYLFNMAGYAYKTQQWVRKIMRSRFSPDPGGLPGNDDLGSMSSWYVLSALGIFPVCPGRPFYTVGAPIFSRVTIHPEQRKQFVIKSSNVSEENCYVQSLQVNHVPYNQLAIPHALIAGGGEMHFVMGNQPAKQWPADKDPVVFSETTTGSRINETGVAVTSKEVNPHELFQVVFTLRNHGSPGTKIVHLFVDGREYGRKHCMLATDSMLTDSIACRLYKPGKHHLRIDGGHYTTIEVVDTHVPGANQPAISDLVVKPIIRQGEKQPVTFSVQNIDGVVHAYSIPVTLNDSLIGHQSISLQPGEQKTVSTTLNVPRAGIQVVSVKGKRAIFKAYADNKASVMLDLDLRQGLHDSIVADRSGFGNNGKIITSHGRPIPAPGDSILLGTDCYIEVPSSASLDIMGETITMMAWVFPMTDNMGLVDVLTKGDNHVLQLTGNKTLSFFAGGWGRGDCTVDLPTNWKNNWHHIAGVCDGKNLYVYIDGELKGSTALEQSANLSVSNKWTIGRNEEFPLQRIFNGYMDQVKVFAAPLTGEEIRILLNKR